MIGITSGLALASGQDGVDDTAAAQQPASPAPGAIEKLARHHVVLIIGLPGDSAHESHFRGIATSWLGWLTRLGVDRQNIVMLGCPWQETDVARPATRDSITETLTGLTRQLTQADRLWLFMLGHADYDGQHARFHIPGADLRAVDFADLLRDMPCEEQVLWLTMSSSGWFLEPLSAHNRVVITATQREAEPNETEFPAALVEAMEKPGAELDGDGDQRITLLELFAKTTEIVEARYRADNRAATEHAMIDDNGDGRGMEWPEIRKMAERIQNSDDPQAARSKGRLDGQHLAKEIVLPILVSVSNGDVSD